MNRTHDNIALGCAISLMVLCQACGARVGLQEDLFPPWSFDAGVSTVFDNDVYADRVLNRPPRLQANCDGLPLPTPSALRTVAGPPRLYPVTLYDPTRARTLVVGGLPAGGRYTREVYAVSSATGAVQPLSNNGLTFDLPIQAGIAWVEPGSLAVMVGGLYPSSMFSTNVMLLQVTQDAIRFVSAGEFPDGVRVLTTAVYDSRRRAVIVHGGQGSANVDPNILGRTWILRVNGLTPQWSIFLETDQSPPPAEARIGGVDPRTGAIVLLGGNTRAGGRDRSVWSLSAGDRPRWARLEGAADAAPRSGSELLWDPVSCGFLLVGGRCSSELWLIRPEGLGVREALLGLLRVGESPGLGREYAGIAFDPAQRVLSAIAGTACESGAGLITSSVLFSLR